MRYFVLSDPHGYFHTMKSALLDAGYFNPPMSHHRLIVCGDAFDRGPEAVEMEKFLLDEKAAGRLIYIRGNHEDLFEQFVTKDYGEPTRQHIHNGTFSTALQLSGFSKSEAIEQPIDFCRELLLTKLLQILIPETVDYFETEHYVFTHGWVPQLADGHLDPAWRNASREAWNEARWINGMKAYKTAPLPDKTVVCGHWHCSWGHWKYDEAPTEYIDSRPFYAKGIIAIDANTAISKTVNILVIED